MLKECHRVRYVLTLNLKMKPCLEWLSTLIAQLAWIWDKFYCNFRYFLQYLDLEKVEQNCLKIEANDLENETYCVVSSRYHCALNLVVMLEKLKPKTCDIPYMEVVMTLFVARLNGCLRRLYAKFLSCLCLCIEFEEDADKIWPFDWNPFGFWGWSTVVESSIFIKRNKLW